MAKLLALLIAVALAFAGLGLAAGAEYSQSHNAQAAPAQSLTADESAAVDRTVASAKDTGLVESSRKLISRVTQGDDTLALVEVDGTDSDGSISWIFPVHTCNGATHVVVKQIFAQGGACAW